MKRTIKIIISLLVLAFLLYGCGELFPFIYEILVKDNPHDQYVYMGDPYILQDKGIYYLYGTTSDNGIEVYMSDNLQTWGYPAGNYRGFALHEEDVWGDHWFWAPEVYKINNKYYMYYTVEEHIAVALSDSPLGPFKQDIKSPIISSRKAIDPHLFIDNDGQAYLYFVLFNNGNEIWSAKLNSDLVSIQEGTMKKCLALSQAWEAGIEPPYANINEGPFVIKHKDLYYLTYSANHYASVNYGVGYAVSHSPNGPWTKYTGNPILQKYESLVGTGHHSLFNDAEGNRKIVYHSHYDSVFVHPRKVHIGDLSFLEKGESPDIMEIITPDITALKH